MEAWSYLGPGTYLLYGGTWIWGGLLIAANVMTHRKGGEGWALALSALAWQFVLFDSARLTPEIVFGGTVFSHQGPSAALEMLFTDLCFYWAGPALLTLAMVPFAFREGFRKALDDHPRLATSTGLCFLSVFTMLGGWTIFLRSKA